MSVSRINPNTLDASPVPIPLPYLIPQRCRQISLFPCSGPISSSKHLDHLFHVSPADGTNLALPGTFDAGADVSAIEEQGINLLTITNLAEISLFVRDSPICRSHAPALAILESSNI